MPRSASPRCCAWRPPAAGVTLDALPGARIAHSGVSLPPAAAAARLHTKNVSETVGVKAPATAPRGPAVAISGVGWGTRGRATWATAVLRDTGTAARAAIAFTAFGARGQVLVLGYSAAVVIREGETTATGARLDVPPGELIACVAADLTVAPATDASAAHIATAGINVEYGGRRLLGAVSSSAAVRTAVTAVCYKAGGAIIGGGQARVGALGAGDATTFQTGLTVPGPLKRCVVYASQLG